MRYTRHSHGSWHKVIYHDHDITTGYEPDIYHYSILLLISHGHLLFMPPYEFPMSIPASYIKSAPIDLPYLIHRPADITIHKYCVLRSCRPLITNDVNSFCGCMTPAAGVMDRFRRREALSCSGGQGALCPVLPLIVAPRLSVAIWEHRLL